MKTYFDLSTKGFNPYQVLTIYPTELSIFGSHTFHEFMMTDAVRMHAFKRAIIEVATHNKKKVWVDVGSGLCPLTLMAAALAKPKKIYAIEQVKSTLLSAEKIVNAQVRSIQEKIELLHGYSFDLSLPEKADILITETIGNFGVEEGIVPLLNDAKKRFLKENAIVIPSELDFIIVPIESERCYQRINFWKSKKCGLDFSAMLPQVTKTVYHHRVLPEELLSRPKKMGSLSLTGNTQIPVNLLLQSEHILERNGTLHGFAGWFRACLYNNVFLSNDPLKKRTPFNWTQAYFPLPDLDKKIIKIKKGQKVKFSIQWNLQTNTLVWDSLFF